MKPWEGLALSAADAIADAARSSPDEERRLIERALSALRQFRRTADSESPDDERQAAYGRLLGVSLTALRLMERSHEILAFTGEPADGAHSASAGIMIARSTLAPAVSALNALSGGTRDEEAEAAVERLAREALPTARMRIDHLHKLAVEEGLVTPVAEDEEQ